MRRPVLLRRSGLPRVPARPSDVAPAEPPDGHRVRLRVLERGDREEFIELAVASRQLHRPWTYPPERPEQFDDLYARSRREDCVCLLACLRDGGEIAGVLILSQMVRGAFQSAFLGYYASARYAGRGYMREAIGLVVDLAFGPLALHRLEANIQPGNAASIALARSAASTSDAPSFAFTGSFCSMNATWRHVFAPRSIVLS
jgi:ribosomal-protein-alanine N-acetyltransferase